jgi:cytochrome c-type protein NapC
MLRLFARSNPSADRPRWRIFLGLAGVAALFLGVAALLVVGGAAGLAWTNTEKFCIGCHEMRDNVYAEYKGTIHDVNRTGVRAICSDCHVPREPAALIKRKMRASLELWGHIRGVVDTKEKFEAHRTQLAHNVWRRMKETDSLECRNCHKRESMDPDKQGSKAKARHEKGLADGKTCIDCHFGIAHKEPAGPSPEELFGVAKTAAAAQ